MSTTTKTTNKPIISASTKDKAKAAWSAAMNDLSEPTKDAVKTGLKYGALGVVAGLAFEGAREVIHWVA